MLNYKHLHYFLTVARTGSITRAAEKLHLTPQTLSGQIGTFEERLGAKLFERAGRRLELSEAGRQALGYAEEIFQIGSELEALLKQEGGQRTRLFRVGIADAVPKAIAHLLIAPGLDVGEQVKLVCVEDRLERLVADLAIHRLDMVLADRPVPGSMDVSGFSHALGECGIGFFCTKERAASLRGEFPHNLHLAPLLLPSEASALRAPILRWLERQEVTPNIVGEFDDTALLQAFGSAGVGVFPLPTLREVAAALPSNSVLLGQTQDISVRFFAISVERHLRHPSVLAITQAARHQLFSRDSKPLHRTKQGQT